MMIGSPMLPSFSPETGHTVWVAASRWVSVGVVFAGCEGEAYCDGTDKCKIG